MKVSDLSDSPYLASDDFKVGTILPIVEIASIVMHDVPVPNSKKTNSKAIAFFKGAKKGWCINKTVARRIGAVLGDLENIEKTWIGARIQLVVVGGVRRPDGTSGNAFRLHGAWKAGGPLPTQSATAPAAPESAAIDNAPAATGEVAS